MGTNDYAFKVIEDTPVPLADMPVAEDYFIYTVIGFAMIVVILLLLIYYGWYAEHKRRILELQAGLEREREAPSEAFKPSLLHPKILAEAEKVLEQKLAEKYQISDSI